jgi:hypothetical protein
LRALAVAFVSVSAAARAAPVGEHRRSTAELISVET